VTGQLKILFTEDVKAQAMIMNPGDIVDIGAGRMHEVWIGASGCMSVNGDNVE
jgi:hypothetical protein